MSIALLVSALLALLGLSGGGGELSGAPARPGDGPSSATSTELRANLKQVVNAVESCAAGRVDGSYRGPSGPSCLDPASLMDFEPGLTPLRLAAAAPTAGSMQLSGIAGDNYGYVVQGVIQHEGTAWYFIDGHRSNGDLLKRCQPGAPFAPSSFAGEGPVPEARRAADPAPGCDEDGTWG